MDLDENALPPPWSTSVRLTFAAGAALVPTLLADACFLFDATAGFRRPMRATTDLALLTVGLFVPILSVFWWRAEWLRRDTWSRTFILHELIYLGYALGYVAYIGAFPPSGMSRDTAAGLGMFVCVMGAIPVLIAAAPMSWIIARWRLALE